MSQANTQSDTESAAQPNNESSDSGIVITNGPGSDQTNSTNHEEENRDAPAETEQPEVTEGPEAEVEAEAEADTEAEDLADEATEPSIDENNDSPADDEEIDAEEPEGETTENSTGSEDDGETDDKQADSETPEPSSDPSAEPTPEEDEPSMSEASQESDSGEVVPSEVDRPPQQLEITTKAGVLQSALDSISVLVDECKLRTSPQGLEIRAVDPANVGMVDLTIEAKGFEGYKADNGVIGIPLDRFEDVIGLGSKSDMITIELDTETRKLHIQVEGVEYTLALIDPDSIRQEPDIPDLNLPAEVVLEGQDINQSVTAADMVSDHIALGVNELEGHFYVDAEGDTDDVHLELEEGDLVDLQASNAHSLFSLDYLKDMNKAIPSKTEATLELGEEFPIKIHFDDEDGAVQVTYMLAPRIQSD